MKGLQARNITRDFRHIGEREQCDQTDRRDPAAHGGAAREQTFAECVLQRRHRRNQDQCAEQHADALYPPGRLCPFRPGRREEEQDEQPDECQREQDSLRRGQTPDDGMKAREPLRKERTNEPDLKKNHAEHDQLQRGHERVEDRDQQATPQRFVPDLADDPQAHIMPGRECGDRARDEDDDQGRHPDADPRPAQAQHDHRHQDRQPHRHQHDRLVHPRDQRGECGQNETEKQITRRSRGATDIIGPDTDEDQKQGVARLIGRSPGQPVEGGVEPRNEQQIKQKREMTEYDRTVQPEQSAERAG